MQRGIKRFFQRASQRQHKKRRQAMGKTLHVSDENYLREAQRLLYDEIAGVMGMNPNEVNAYILERVDLSA